MIKYYTRACNFYYGANARLLIRKKLALSLCGNKGIAFDKIEIFTRNKNNFFHISFIFNISLQVFLQMVAEIRSATIQMKTG